MNTHRYRVPALILTLAVLGAGALIFTNYRKAGPDPDVLARVGQQEIRRADFEAAWARRSDWFGKALSKQELLEDMIQFEVLVDRARHAGLDQDPEFRRAYRNLLVGTLQQRELEPKVEAAEVTKPEIQRAYDEDQARHRKPARLRFALLEQRTHDKMSAEQVKAARARLEQARELAAQAATASHAQGFGPMAIEHSTDQATRYRGGDIGWFTQDAPGLWPKEVIDAGFALEQPGDLSPIVESRQGFYLVKLVDRREATVTPLKDVQEAIGYRLLRDKREAVRKQFIQTLRASVLVTVYSNVLDSARLVAVRAAPETPPALP